LYKSGKHVAKTSLPLYITMAKLLLLLLHVVMLAMMGHMVVLGTALGTLMVPGYWSLQMG